MRPARTVTARTVTALVAAGALAVTVAATTAPVSSAQGGGTQPGGTTVTEAEQRRSRMPDPLVISHRGASGYRPEHTEAAYRLAVQQGADYIEPDLVMTKDGVLVDRHEPEIGGTTDVADHPEFADRETTKQLDGQPVTGWFVEDFTLAELKTLRATERLPELRDESAMYDGREEILTFEEGLRLRERLSKESGRTIGIIPEIKHSTYLHEQGLDPEAELARLVKRYRLNHRSAPMWTQSFELSNLKDLREKHGYRANLAFLTTAAGGPFDLADEGTTYAELTTAGSLRRLSRWLDGIGPEKAQVIPRTADGSLGEPTSLVADAHRADLQVTPWTFRAENEFLPADHRVGEDPARFGRAIDEARAFLDAGVDGLFCDQPDVCVTAREDFWAERSRRPGQPETMR